MKTQALDYLLSAALIGVLCLLDYLLVGWGLRPITERVFGAYHILVDGLLLLLGYGLLAVLCARLMLRLRPFTPATYSMEDTMFTWWKLYTVNYEFGRGALLPYTTVFARPLVAVLFGARIGRDIALGGRLVDPELITIGEEAIIGQDSVITAHAIISGALILRPVNIAARATIGVNAVIMPGVDVGEGSIVTAGAVVTMDTKIPPGELWGGIPARKIKDVDAGTVRG